MSLPQAMHHELPVLSVGFADSDPPELPDLNRVIAYYAGVGTGIRVVPSSLGSVRLAKRIGFYAQHGGMGHPPQNSQALAELAVQSLLAVGRTWTAQHLLLVAPSAFWPHTWRLRRGGVHLGERRFCTRYCIVPADATVGAIAHELGHLLFDWPDWPQASGVADFCLMGRGGYQSNGTHPSPPCALLRVAAGLGSPFAIHSDTPLGDLAQGNVGEFTHQDQRLLFEWREDLSQLVVYHVPASLLAPSRVLGVAVTERDRVRPVLAVALDLLLQFAKYSAPRSAAT